MSLLLLAIGDKDGPISAMLSPIQELRFFQRMGQGDSDAFMGRQPSSNPLQGLCQGNGAVPACWIMLSSLMMRVYQCGGYVSIMVDSICREMLEFMVKKYVNDTNLLTFLLDEYNIEVVLKWAQSSLDKWSQLLNVAGGGLNPAKYYWYMISYICREGVWG
jgi:hypothetical protein